MKKTIFAISILLTFSIMISAALLAGDQDKGKVKTTTAVQKVEGHEVKTNTDKCGHCAHKYNVKKAEENSKEKCDCDNCEFTKGSLECRAKHAAGECKHDAGKDNQLEKEKK